MKLTDREWKSFRIYDIFSHERGKRQVENSRLKGDIPYYSASQNNNGLTDFIANPLFITTTNAIIYSTFGDAYYVQKNFTVSDEMTILTNEKLNMDNGLFVCTCLNQNKSKYSFGRKAFSNKISKDKIMLPINIAGDEPDWSFMEKYIKEQITSKEQLYEQYLNQSLNSLDYKEIVPLADKQWGEFYITELFPEIQRGKRLTKANQIKGDVPYISSTSLNNGVDNFISNKEKVRKFKDCISIANSGSVGASFYQKFEFVASDHVTHLKNDSMNQYIYLFIVTMLNRLSDKYNFNREINDKRIAREKILLPVNELNQPDFEYMEQYIKNLLLLKYQQYSLKIV